MMCHMTKWSGWASNEGRFGNELHRPIRNRAMLSLVQPHTTTVVENAASVTWIAKYDSRKQVLALGRARPHKRARASQPPSINALTIVNTIDNPVDEVDQIVLSHRGSVEGREFAFSGVNCRIVFPPLRDVDQAPHLAMYCPSSTQSLNEVSLHFRI
jgi:hypothetical protein